MAAPSLLDGGLRVRLPLASELDMKAAEPLKQAIAACRGRDLELDGSAVVRMGGQCLQIILSAVRTWKAEGRAMSIVDPSPEFIDHLEMLGVRPAESPMERAA